MTGQLRLVSPWRAWIRRHRSGAVFASAWLTTFWTANVFIMGWLWGLPLAMLSAAALLMAIREIIITHRLEVRRIESASRDVRPRAGTWRRTDGSVQEVRFIETSETGVFLAVDVDGEPVLLKVGEAITVDVIGPGQAVTWGQLKG